MPLYGGVVKKKFIPLYNDEDVSKFHQANPNINIQRYKGLGEMNPDQLAVCVLDPDTRCLQSIPYPDNPAAIFNLMLKAELKRELV